MTTKKTTAKTYRRRTTTKKDKVEEVLLGGALAGVVGVMIPGGALGKIAAAFIGKKQKGIIKNTALGLGILGAAELGGQMLGDQGITGTGGGSGW